MKSAGSDRNHDQKRTRFNAQQEEEAEWAGVALMETGSGSENDLDELLGRLLPRDNRHRHRHGAEPSGDVTVTVGHGADHLLPVLVSPSVVVPMVDGRPQLGTWQSVVLVDLNADNTRRRVRLSFVAG